VSAGPLFDLGGRVVVVTGGAGQLGRQYASALVEHGARVVVLDTATEPSSPEWSQRFSALEDSGSLLRIQADVTDRQALERAAKRVEAEWGDPPYGLINNAAIDAPPDATAEENGRFEEYPKAAWERVMDVNVTGVLLCCQVFGGRMARAGRGSIVNISSIYGLVSPDQNVYEYRRARGEEFYKPVAYSVSKSAVLNLTRYLATYWGRSGVRVNTLTLAGVFNEQEEEFLKAYTRRIPIGRMAREAEYNGAVVFLCSDASRYMTGANLIIDGGWTAW